MAGRWPREGSGKTPGTNAEEVGQAHCTDEAAEQERDERGTDSWTTLHGREGGKTGNG
jgi:hypothetical protein